MESTYSADLARTALSVALDMYVRNYPNEKVTKVLRARLLEKINDLIDAGMTDSEFLASFSINRARRH